MMRIFFVPLVAVLVACNGTEPSPETSQPAATTSTTPVTTTAPVEVGGFEETVVRLSPDGTHLVDSDGRSLYLFTLDTDRTSSCEGDCASAWPPLRGDPVAGEGVDPLLLGNSERRDGSIQVTYAGHPLYRYHGDVDAGDTGGHGFNELWFLVGADGDPLDG